MDDLQTKIEKIIYPNVAGLVWTREEQVNRLLALVEEEKQFILAHFQQLSEYYLRQERTHDTSFIYGIWKAGVDIKGLVKIIRNKRLKIT
jgi:hypothetical protein